MRKAQKLWKKQKKRIVKLLYKKGFIDMGIDALYWENVDPNTTNNDYVESFFKYKGRQDFIDYLAKLPTIINNSKANQVLNFKNR
jgi:hypothetical protein